jgi:hypothetical protein
LTLQEKREIMKKQVDEQRAREKAAAAPPPPPPPPTAESKKKKDEDDEDEVKVVKVITPKPKEEATTTTPGEIRLLRDGVNPSRLQFTVRAILQEKRKKEGKEEEEEKQPSSDTSAQAVMDIHPAAQPIVGQDLVGQIQALYRQPVVVQLVQQFVAEERGDPDTVDARLCGILGRLNSAYADRRRQATEGLLDMIEAMVLVVGKQPALMKIHQLLAALMAQ